MKNLFQKTLDLLIIIWGYWLVFPDLLLIWDEKKYGIIGYWIAQSMTIFVGVMTILISWNALKSILNINVTGGNLFKDIFPGKKLVLSYALVSIYGWPAVFGILLHVPSNYLILFLISFLVSFCVSHFINTSRRLRPL